MLLFTLGLAVLIFCWSRELFGPWGGVFSLGLFALDPTVLAHSGLATTDAAAACTIVLAVYLLRNHLRRPSQRGLLLAGVGTGLALASKFSALILIPITGLILLAIALQPALDSGALAAKWQELKLAERITAGLKLFFLIGILGAVTVWVVYGCKIEAKGSKPRAAAARPFLANGTFPGAGQAVFPRPAYR